MSKHCCPYAEDYLTFRYDEISEEESVEWFQNNPPYWTVRGAESDWRESHRFSQTPLNIKFCPACGTALPKLKLKAVLPKKIMIVTDGGYYCDTCKKRLDSCQCKRPKDMWEVDDGK